MGNLADELTRKEVIRFQLNGLNGEFIEDILKKNPEGLFNLSSKISDGEQRKIMGYLLEKHSDYSFELKREAANFRIYFQYNELA